jgi:hypothetical protein
MSNPGVDTAPPTLFVFVYDTVRVEDVSLQGFLYLVAEWVGVSLTEYKAALGSIGSALTEEELLRVFNLSDRLAGILFDMWRNKSNNAIE